MGIVRLLLAVSVVVLHTGPILGFYFVGGDLAVQSFYIISGFYMAMIISEKYVNVKRSYYYFITNRVLKLYPLYLTVLLLTFILGCLSYYFFNSDFIFREFIDSRKYLHVDSLLIIIVSNILLLGQDILFFVGIDKISGELIFLKDYPITNQIKMHHFLLVSQAWTISLELLFYLIAPFLNRLATRNLLILFFILILVRTGFYYNGFVDRPWSYQFFPFELAIFIAGMLSYRVYLEYCEKSLFDRVGRKLVLYLMVPLFLCFSIQFIKYFNQSIYYILYLLGVFIIIPFFFHFTKNNSWDRRIGELSYPVYLSHILISYVVSRIVFTGSPYFGLAVLAFTVLFSVSFNLIIQDEFEGIRSKRILKH